MNLGYVLISETECTEEETKKIFEILQSSLENTIKHFFHKDIEVMTKQILTPQNVHRLTVITNKADLDSEQTLRGLIASMDIGVYQQLIQEDLLRGNRRYDFVIGSKVLSNLDGQFVYAKSLAQQKNIDELTKKQQEISNILGKYNIK